MKSLFPGNTYNTLGIAVAPNRHPFSI
jgi:hypothetical protein